MRTLMDIGIFLAHRMVLTFGIVFLLGIMVERLALRRRGGAVLPPLLAGRVMVAVCAAFLAAFVAVAAWYVMQDGFAGDVEPVVTNLSWQVVSGQPLYTTFDQAECYSVLYGPSAFLTNGLFLKVLGPSLATAKLASILASLGSLVFLYAAVARRKLDRLALATVTGTVLYYWAQGFSVYLVRPDSLLLFAVSFGFFAAVRARPWLAVVAVAALAGFTINLKVHCFLYFLPVVAVLGQRLGWVAAFRALLGAAALAAAPFVFHPQISAGNYLQWLIAESEHGLQLELLVQPARYAAFLGLPLAVAVWLRGARYQYLGGQKLLVLSLVPATAVSLVLSMKPGSGIVHILPLVPSAMFAFARLARPLVEEGAPAWRRSLMRPAVAAVVVTAVYVGTVDQYRALRLVDWQFDQVPGIAADVEGILDRYGELPTAMALGGENMWYRYTWIRPLLAFRGNPVLLDPISVMDLVKAGKTLPPATYDALTEGKVALWLVPRTQDPFHKMSWYDPDTPIFPPEFVAHFRSCYTLRGQSRYFDLWFWNGLDPEASATAASLGVTP